MRHRSSSLLLATSIFGLSASAGACSSTATVDPSSPSAPAAPEWVDRPGGPVAADEGRAATVPVTIRAADPAKVAVEAVAEGVDAEITADDAPPADGAWHGKLRIRVRYGAAASASLEVKISDGTAPVVVPVPLRSRPLVWKKRLTWDTSKGPQSREHGIFVVDEKAKAVFLFQGSGYDPQWKPIEDSWRLDLASDTWSSWKPTGDVPTARAAHRVAVVPGTSTAFVYGGYTGFGGTEKSEGELYRLDVANAAKNFTRLTNVGAALPRQLHTIAYDAKGERLVVFGGFTDLPRQDALDDTWLVTVSGDTATWTKVESTGPSARYGSFTVFDAESRRLVVWSGGQMPEVQEDPVNAAQDGWALDLAATPPTWSKLTPAGEAPKGRRNGCAMHDPAGRRMFVYGGTSNGKSTEQGLFALDLEKGHERWSKVDLPNAPPIRSSGFVFTTPEGDVVCAFGNGTTDYRDAGFLGYAP